MHSKIDNIEIMSNDKADEVIEKSFRSLLNRHQNKSEKLMESSEFFFDCVHLLCYKCHNTNPNCHGSHIASPYWIKSKKQQ